SLVIPLLPSIGAVTIRPPPPAGGGTAGGGSIADTIPPRIRGASMRVALAQLFDDAPRGEMKKLTGIYALLVAANVIAWLGAFAAFAGQPALLGTALLAYVLGLRHAVDADHIAAIDNVVRKLMQEGRRPYSVGLFFALGHSTVVVLASLVVA